MSTVSTEDQQAIRAALQRWLDATMKADADALHALLTPEYTYTHTTSSVDERDVWLESFRTGGRIYHPYEVFEERYRALPGGAVLVNGRSHQEMSPQGQWRELNARFSCVWVPADGGWKIAMWQATRIPDPA